jgi:HAD superfamily hydrolase (TIGR01549 family)
MKKLAAHSVISFDIFDTLLLRPYMRPVDLFFHLERIINQPGFAEERIRAEKKLHAEKPAAIEEVTFDQIYDEINPKYRAAKEREIALEEQVLFANPEIKSVYDHALTLNKRVVIISDMYHSRATLERMLKKNGYDNFEKLYVSSEYLQAKHTGNLYRHIPDELKVSAADILHIGDNQHADYDMARRNGWQAFHYPAPGKEFLALPRNKRMLDLQTARQDSLTISISTGLAIKRWLKNNRKSGGYWQDFGYHYGGPLCYGLTKFMLDEIMAQGIKEAVFVARDGYTLRKIFNLLQTGEIKTHYVYAPRIFNLATSLQFRTDLPHQVFSILKFFKERSRDLAHKLNKQAQSEVKAAVAAINENMELIKSLAQEAAREYAAYLNGFSMRQHKIAVLDLSAMSFNSLKLLTRFMPNKELLGIYLLVSSIEKNNFAYKEFRNARTSQDSGKNQRYFATYNILELLVTAPEPPICGLNDGKPVYVRNKHEANAVRLYEKIAVEELAFARDLKETFGSHDVKFEYDDLVELIDSFTEHATAEDLREFANVFLGTDEMHTSYCKFDLKGAGGVAKTKKQTRINLKLLLAGFLFPAFIYKAYAFLSHKGKKSWLWPLKAYLLFPYYSYKTYCLAKNLAKRG